MRDLLTRVIVLWAVAGGLLLLVIVGATAFNVGTYVLDAALRPFGGNVAPLGGYEDIVILFVGAGVTMLLPYCQLRRGHVSVDIFVERMPAAAQRLVDRLSTLLMAATALFLLYWTVQGALESRADHISSLVLGWPEWPFYLPAIVSLGLWAVAALLILGEEPASSLPGAEGPG